ncbi:MAG TPA: imidazole glycerol phosphate synthase subunit HisH [Gemmatimonadaceae bacterium]|nr:imidazole glycerol phosphate synthase subunit HisH [Gemmatimonadaceae bacterium]
MIAIVDMGIGNTGSLLNMFKKIGVEATPTTDPQTILNADKVVLPGVGSFHRAAQRLTDLGVREAITRAAGTGKPLLGICLGMQLLTRRSEEGGDSGLDLIPGETVRFRAPEGSRLKIPHMGWNTIKKSGSHPLFADMPADSRFYFVHSYHVVCDSPDVTIAETDYGGSFASSIARDNVMGVQFHPEKSHRFGMQLLENFAKRI